MKFGEPETVAEYRAMSDFVNDFEIIGCEHCGDEFKWKRSKGQIPRTCSDHCRRIREARKNADRQRRWRQRHGLTQ